MTDKKSKPKKDFIVEVTKNKKEIAPEELENKWGVSPMVGVLKSNSFSQASALDKSLNKNDFSGGNTLSYGINVSYKLNNKWAIKSGIQLQKTVFTTNDVVVTSSAFVTANDLENVVFNLNNGPSNSDNDITNDFGEGDVTSENGNLIQSYGYIEIPIEVKYTFFSAKKIKTSVISGFSSLILNENSVVGESESFNDDIGGAGNLNTINFSGNFGIDFDFSISKKINLNINPMFKTQLNTFSNNSNGFKPYTIGVYSGIRYQF